MSESKRQPTEPVLLTATVLSKLTKAREHLDVGPNADYPTIIEELLATHETDFSEWPDGDESN